MGSRGAVLKEIHFIRELPAPGNHAGNKARMDVNQIMVEEFGPSEFGYKEKTFSNIIEKMKYILNPFILHELYNLYRITDNRLFMQYPFYANPILEMILEHIVEKNYVVLVVHDVDSLRDFGKAKISKEIALFNKCTACIVHNMHMKHALEKLGVSVPMVVLHLFDYLRSNDNAQERKLGNRIAFAGNLSKSNFIEKLENLPEIFYLYGPGGERLDSKDNISYKGSFTPDEVPDKLEGSFGLIWDGDSITDCEGSFGRYMQYNNPHKLSLYISAKLPVIVWSKAAIADFVKEHHIGFCVDSLEDINKKITEMKVSDYESYLCNISGLQNRVIHGEYMRDAIKKAKQFFY